MTGTASSSPCARPAPPSSTWRPTAGSATAGSPKDRLSLCKAYIAKAVWDFPTTRDLIDALRHRPTLRRLCGWETLGEVPSEATFSRAFAAFAQDALPQSIHQAMLKTRYGDKIAGHLSRDATVIHAREKAAKKEPKPVAQPAEAQDPVPPEPTRLQRQVERPRDENIADLPRACDWGTKKDSKGKKLTWRGYKLHLDTADGDLPVCWLLTSASRHDSQAAIPLAQMSAERVHSHRHDNHGGRHVRVRGAVKVAAHLSFGLLVIAAEQLLRMLC